MKLQFQGLSLSAVEGGASWPSRACWRRTPDAGEVKDEQPPVRIKHQIVEEDFGTALVKGLDLAKSIDAKSLPGWSGADPSTN
jgi:hypothetical protein